MRRKALLSIILSAGMILGSASSAFAAGQMPSNEVTSNMEVYVSESSDEVGMEHADRDNSSVNTEKKSDDAQEPAEVGESGTEAEAEEDGIEEENNNEGSKHEIDSTDSAEEEEEKAETLVGAEGERVSVGDNVTAGFDRQTGTLTFYSQGGTLFRDWFDRLGVSEDFIVNIAILVILSPINVQETIYLPYTFVDASGAEYSSLPKGLSESIRLTKEGADIPDDPKNIADATITGITNKTYTGTAQTQNPTVKLGDMTLTAGTDYTLSYANNTNAGTATVKITGMGNYTGTISKTFTINQAVPALTFASTSITKTTQDAEFTNALTKITDGSVTFASSNSSVATVNSTSGKVTIKGAGTTVITATAAAGTNYKAGSAQYTLTVTKVLNIVSLSDDFYGKTGTPASFHIEAEGSGTVSYQWQYRTAGSTSWKTPSQASAKTADYVFNLRPSYDNIEVRCIVSDEFGNEIISETRKANVFAYTSQPKDATAAEGQAVNFEVSAIGRGITYQWYYKRPNSTWKKAAVSGSKTAVLPITAGTKNDGTSYRCVITDETGNKITSAAGTLTLETPLQITGMSEDSYDVNGKNVTFHIDAVGNGDLSYQWQYKLAGETKWRTPGLASAKTADYVFKLRLSYDNIEVRCIVKDASGNSVTSDVRKANVFAITSQPQDTELALGEKTTFAVEAVGRELTYQWYYMRPEGSWKKVIVAGYNTASLVITANTKNDGTKFRCRITDGLGNILVSSAATLTQS